VRFNYLQDNLIHFDLRNEADRDMFHNMCKSLQFTSLASLCIYVIDKIRDCTHLYNLLCYNTCIPVRNPLLFVSSFRV